MALLTRPSWPWLTWKTATIRSRPLSLGDVSTIYHCLHDEEFIRYLYPYGRRSWLEALRFVLEAKWQMFLGRAIYYVREDVDSGKILALVIAQNINPKKPHAADIHLWRDKDARGDARRGEGHGRIWFTFLFEEVGLHRLVSLVDERNVRALRLLEGGNMTFEGVRHLDHRDDTGVYSTYQWSLLRTDPEAETLIADVKDTHGWPPRPAAVRIPEPVPSE